MYKYYALKDTIEEIPDSIEPIAFQNFNEAKDIQMQLFFLTFQIHASL